MKFILTLIVTAALLVHGLPASAQETKGQPGSLRPKTTAAAYKAPDEPSTTEVDTSYRTAARGGIIAGTVFEGLGLVGMLTGTALTITKAGGDAGLGVIVAAGGVFTTGGFISTVAHTSRHRAYKEAGILTRQNMPAFSWLFTSGTTVLWVVAVAKYAQYKSSDEAWDEFGNSIGIILASGAAMACEILNLAVFRLLWRRDMNRAEDDAMLATIVVAPMLSRPGLSISGVF